MKSIEQAKEAIRRYFGDTGRSPEETREGLDELIDDNKTKAQATAGILIAHAA